jgi:hypothetical protein
MLRLIKGLEMRPGSGDCGLLVCNGSTVPLRLGLIFTVELEGCKAQDAIQQVMVREAQADKVVLQVFRGLRHVACDGTPVPVLQQLEISYAVLVEWRHDQGREREAARDVGPLALKALRMDLVALQGSAVGFASA